MVVLVVAYVVYKVVDRVLCYLESQLPVRPLQRMLLQERQEDPGIAGASCTPGQVPTVPHEVSIQQPDTSSRHII
jgi:hypothetical protein